ncbi:MAG: HAD family phosphatase [Myxococcota bacterium]|nr:HAD family phosphatase [Myxococcota bacterium]
MVTATLFDFDGVLVDSEPVHLAAFNDVLANEGIAIDEATYAARYLSLDDAGVFRAVLSERVGPRGAPGGHSVHEGEEQRVRALVEAKSPRFMARFAESFRAFPGAADLVARRAARGPVGIVSGALELEILFALEKMGISSAVAFVVSADRPIPSKPDPAPYRAAAEELRRMGHAGGAVAVEDSLGGVASARGAGLRCVGVAHAYSAAELRRAGANEVVASLDALTDDLLEGPQE